MYGWSFDKINVIFACCEDTYSRYCIKKSNNDHFHPFALILFNIKSCSFSVVKNDCDFLYWKNLSPVFAPEKPRDVAFTLPVLKRVQRWQASWRRSINVFKKLGSLALHPAPNRAHTCRTRRSLFVWSLPYDLFGMHGPTRSTGSLRHANCPTTIRWWPHSEQPLKFGPWVNVPSS